MDNEQSEKKKTPDKVHMLLRNKFQPKDYVTSQQIKSLFSCWTKEFKNGKSLVSEATDTPLNGDANEDKNDFAWVFIVFTIFCLKTLYNFS